MAELPKSQANMDAMQFEVSWGGETIGWINDADPSGLTQKTIDRTIGELNSIVVDKIIRGLEGTVTTVLHEVKVARLRSLMPWAGASGSFSISPTSGNFSMYANAKELRLHPRGAADATNDIVLLKAFPVLTLPRSAGPTDHRSVSITWHCFPDQTALVDEETPATVYGYIGDPPGGEEEGEGEGEGEEE